MTNIELLKQQFQEYCNQQYDQGYKEGQSGQPYSGRTFIGYHGWYWGRRSTSK